MRSFSIALLLFLLCAHLVHAGVPHAQATVSTPYDGYLSSVRKVLRNQSHHGPANFAEASRLVWEGREFSYDHHEPYYPADPETTEQLRAGDCKDKALWLCARLADPAAHFVIGKFRLSSRANHAWLLWPNGGRWWILDCTMARRPMPLDRAEPDMYLPLYSYHAGESFAYPRNLARAKMLPRLQPERAPALVANARSAPSL